MNKPRHYVVYIPGFGSGMDPARRVALKFWRLFGARTELVPMRWFDGGGFDAKLERVMTAIRAAEAAGYTVSLVGESAGGSMAINVAARHPHLHRLVTIAGANDPHAKVSPLTLQKAPAFDTSIQRLAESLPRIDRTQTHTVRALADNIVRDTNTIIENAHNHRVPSVGHMLTITLCLSVFSPYIVALITRRR